MQHHLIQTAFKIALALLIFSTLNGKDIPIMKTTTIELPVSEYSIIKFPFKVAEARLGSYKYKKIKGEVTPIIIKNNANKNISLSKKNPAVPAPIVTSGENLLNIKKIDNFLTFRPRFKGTAEIVVWGNKDFPMIIKIDIVDDADKNINFVQVLNSRKEVINFESNPHEKVLENIMRFLHNSEVNKKPRGYENIVRKEVYDVAIRDRQGVIFARVRVSLTKEVAGKIYVGQEWNVNIVEEFDNENETVEIPNGFYLTLYEEMFDSEGVFAVSLETYTITKEHGTRVFIVRNKEQR
ncbi:hypothetical protein [Sulfurimonas sp.]|uniref:hypothetical protein n=1 Tax=Sulfurimonas sp. TaxID=2022749 RepID=UPI0025E1F1E9|nr:hypothetical protein [Sulfurimonas sp.]